MLAVPTCYRDTLFFPGHRMYGPERFQLLLTSSGLTMLGRVWSGQVVRGGVETAARRPKLWAKDCRDWRHQQVVVLQKPARHGVAPSRESSREH